MLVVSLRPPSPAWGSSSRSAPWSCVLCAFGCDGAQSPPKGASTLRPGSLECATIFELTQSLPELRVLGLGTRSSAQAERRNARSREEICPQLDMPFECVENSQFK